MKKNNNNKIIISIFIFFTLLLLSISIILINNSSKKINSEIDKEKIYYEIKYFDSQFNYMFSLINNIEGNSNFYIDWEELEKQVKVLQEYWNSVILDFNNLEIDKNYLTDFGKDLDNLSISIKNTNKENTLNNLIVLYNKILRYGVSLNDYFYNTILVIKFNLFNAYSVVETGNWTLAHEYILKASDEISNLVNSIENSRYNQYNVNQAYIAIKELENMINIKDIDVFYFKYNNAINKLNIL